MTKYFYNYDSGEYEYIERDGYSETRGCDVYSIKDFRLVKECYQSYIP